MATIPSISSQISIPSDDRKNGGNHRRVVQHIFYSASKMLALPSKRFSSLPRTQSSAWLHTSTISKPYIDESRMHWIRSIKKHSASREEALYRVPSGPGFSYNPVMAANPSISSQLTTRGGNTSNESKNDGKYRRGVKYLVDSAPDMVALPSQYALPLQRSPLLADHGSIPVIDLSGLGGPIEDRMCTVQAISSACADWGFFRIINHGIKIALMDEMLKVSEGFFSLNWEEKMQYASDDVMSPVRYGTSLNTPKNHPLHWRDFLRHYGHPVQNSFHLWPDNPPNYRNVVKQYLQEMWHLALEIAGAISEGLGLNQDYIEKSLGDGIQFLASNYYPPCPQPDLTLGLAAHSDHGGLTILMQNEVDGLQVKHNEKWVAVQHVPGTFVVNVGDYLEILSNGRYRSVEHRATVNSQKARISVGVGHGPELTAKVAPASPLVDEKNAIKYMPITYKDYVRYQQSCPLRGKSPLQAIMTNTTKEQ